MKASSLSSLPLPSFSTSKPARLTLKGALVRPNNRRVPLKHVLLAHGGCATALQRRGEGQEKGAGTACVTGMCMCMRDLLAAKPAFRPRPRAGILTHRRRVLLHALPVRLQPQHGDLDGLRGRRSARPRALSTSRAGAGHGVPEHKLVRRRLPSAQERGFTRPQLVNAARPTQIVPSAHEVYYIKQRQEIKFCIHCGPVELRAIAFRGASLVLSLVEAPVRVVVSVRRALPQHLRALKSGTRSSPRPPPHPVPGRLSVFTPRKHHHVRSRRLLCPALRRRPGPPPPSPLPLGPTIRTR
jgi:hypothetical protein